MGRQQRDGAGSSQLTNSYACSPHDYSGSEYIYAWTAEEDGFITVSVDEGFWGNNDLDIIVLIDQGLGCNPASCLDWDYQSVTFWAQTGRTYYYVVDGYDGGTGSYDINMTCGF